MWMVGWLASTPGLFEVGSWEHGVGGRSSWRVSGWVNGRLRCQAYRQRCVRCFSWRLHLLVGVGSVRSCSVRHGVVGLMRAS